MYKFNAKRDIPLLIILILAAVIRFHFINLYEFWYDEAITGILMYAKPHDFWFALMHENTPPLYYLLIKTWSFVFGINDLSLRLPSLILGVVTVALIYLTARKYFGEYVGYIAGVLAAINPFFVGYSIEARTYALYGFLAALAFYALLDKKDKLFICAILLLSVTQYMSAFFVFIMMVYFIFRRSFVDKKGLKYIFFVSLPIFLAYVYAYHKVKMQNLAGQYIDWVRPADFWNIPRSFISYIFGIKSKSPGADWLLDYKYFTSNIDVLTIGGVLFVLFVIGLIYVLYKDKKLEYYLAFCLLFIPQFAMVLLFKLSIYKVYVERYLFPSSIFAILLVALLLSKLPKFVAYSIIGVYAIFLLFAIRPDYYMGMKALYTIYGKYPYEIGFTSPEDYTIGKYYFQNASNVKLYNPQDPGNTYAIYELIPRDFLPTDLNTTLMISPDPARITPDYTKISESGNYSAYTKNKK